MKKLAYSGAVASALSILVSPFALASGWIVVDPITPVGIPRPHPGIVVTPPHPGDHAPPPPGHTTLHGNVSFGLHLQSEQVKVDVNGPVARTSITQVFSNDSDSNLAGTYLFPLPEDTTFSSFSLQIDGKQVEGQILEANEARTEYETIVRRMVDPGLLEYAGYNTVRARIFPIPAHGTKKIELEYTQAMKADGGLYKYRFPLKAEQNAEPADDIKIDVKLASDKGLRTIWSPTQTIASTRDGDHKATISYEEKDVLPDKDFNLYFSVSDKEMNADFMAQKKADENGYFLLSVAPPVEAKAIEKKDIILVADTSGSMEGEKLEQCKKAMKYVIEQLNPGDRFGMVQFNTDVETFKSQLLDATAENKKSALKFVDELEARGGTNIGDAVASAATMLKNDDGRPAYIVLMTDGEPTVGETNVDKLLKIADTKRDIRLFDFGVGYDVNTRLLNKLADSHHGVSQYVEPAENLETALSAFYQKIKSPVLSNVQIAYEGIEVKDVYPKEVKDIFAGSQVMLMGRYKNAGDAKVKISGTLDGKSQSFTFPVKFPAEESGHSYLNRLWAMRRIGYLTDVAQSNGETKEVIDEIVALSKKYGIISQYTSFLASDPSENSRLPMGRPMPTRAMSFAPDSAHATMLRGSMGGAMRKSYAAAPASDMQVQKAPTVGRHQHYVAALPLPGSPAPFAGQSIAAPGMGGSADSFSSPAQFQAIDGRPIIRDFRNSFTGRDAVVAAKDTSALQQSSSLDNKSGAGVKAVDDKTFYLVQGFWTDSDYDAKTQKPEEVEFGSKHYFDLIAGDPDLAKYFAAGTQVLVVHKGHCYKVVQPATATG
ncbi:MAG TPA: VIT domain-containing protein [Planktothrix sp.]|jgi:Ca-activated chloride channel family protein